MIKFNSILKYIHHLLAIYINPVIAVYLIKVGLGLGEDASVAGVIWFMFAGLPKFKRNSFTK